MQVSRSHFYIFIGSFLYLTGLFQASFAQNLSPTKSPNLEAIKVSSRVDSTSIVLGDQTVLHLVVEAPINAKIQFPVLSDTLSGGKIQVVKTGTIDTLPSKTSTANPLGRITLQKNYTLTSFDSGTHLIPAFEFKASGRSYKSIPIPLIIRGLSVDTAKGIFDIKQPIYVTYTFWDWIKDNRWWIMGIVLIIILVIGIYLFVKKRPRKVSPQLKVEPSLMAHQKAIHKLNDLQSKKLWQQGQLKEYYYQISIILREYLDNRYDIQSIEQTTDEIFKSLRSISLSKEDNSQLKQILTLSDLVKFAKETPESHQNERTLEQAFSFIENTQEKVDEIVKENTTLSHEN